MVMIGGGVVEGLRLQEGRESCVALVLTLARCLGLEPHVCYETKCLGFI